MRDVEEHPDLATQFTSFGRTMGDRGALSRAMCLRAAADPAILALLDGAEPAQRRPNLLMAAVHYLLLTGADDPLADCYPSVVHVRGGGSPLVVDDDRAGELFAAFCTSHRRALEGLVAERATQTNEIGRCAALLPALATVARRSGAPVSLIDLGASAGLNLLFDRYHYAYEGEGRDLLGAGGPGGGVRIDCALRGGGEPPLSMPAVSWRAGVDLRPGDPADPDQAQWLLACLWPHDLARFVRLQAALALARALPARERPVVHRGDLVSSLGGLADAAPGDSELCVFHSWVAAYLTTQEQRALGRALEDVGRRRRVWWIYAELPYETPELPTVAAPPDHDDHTATALMLVRLEGDDRRAERLADMHHHGAWLHWWGGD